jgi:GT2 family glycosyltransferase
MSAYLCSVVIPSYNRRDTLELLLTGLEQQTLSPTQFEVIVVLDGSTDSSEEMLNNRKKSSKLPGLRWLNQPNSGQATARNRGVELAQAPIILFLDDDVIPEPDLVKRHLEWYKQDEAIAVLGDYRMPLQDDTSLYQLSNWMWWEKMFYNRALPEHQPGYHDFCTGNVSLRKEDYLKVGGLDTNFRGYGSEDYELGYRLLKAGVRFIIEPRAKASHLHYGSEAKRLKASGQEAHGERLLGLKHPELRNSLRTNWMPSGRAGKVAWLGLHAPFIGDRLLGPSLRLLTLFAKLKMRRRWLMLFSRLQDYTYWRGVRQAFGSAMAWQGYRMESPTDPEQTLDITDGLPQSLPPIWINGPSSLTVTYRGKKLGTIRLPHYIEEPLPEYLANMILQQLQHQLWTILDQEKLDIFAGFRFF